MSLDKARTEGEMYVWNRNTIFRKEGQAAERLHVASAVSRHRSRAGLGICNCGPRVGRKSFGICLWNVRVFRDGSVRVSCSVRAGCGAVYRGSYTRSLSDDLRFARVLRDARKGEPPVDSLQLSL